MGELNESKLLPCPFCGAEPVCEGKPYRYSVGSIVNTATCAVICPYCSTQFGRQHTRKAAKEIWNRCVYLLTEGRNDE